jgi:hypothetical protein
VNVQSRPTMLNKVQPAEVLARQGIRLPPIVLKRLREAGIYCQPTLSIEYQNAAKKHVLRGVESGGAVATLGAYASFVDEQGEPLAWLQRVDSIAVNGVHAVVVAPVLIRLEMVRIERTYDLLITRHSLAAFAGTRRPQLESSIVFYGRRGSLEMELWGKDAVFSGAVSPVFYNRAGETLTPPTAFQDAVARVTTAVCCLGCRHSHLMGPRKVTRLAEETGPEHAAECFAGVQSGVG